jgi:hypothetical protein
MGCIKRKNLHQEKRPDVTYLRRLRQKRRIPLCGGWEVQNGDPSHPPPSPSRDADAGSKVADLGKAANPHVMVCSKVTGGLYVASHKTKCGFGQNSHFSANSLKVHKCENFLGTDIEIYTFS